MTLILGESHLNSALEQASAAYYKLVLIVGPTGSGKSALLKAAAHYNFKHLNIGEAFSRELLSKPLHLRSAEAEEVAIDLVNATGATRLAIDNTEVLFEAPMQLNPLALLKRLSIDRLIVATWNGTFDDSCLYYGIKGHPAYEEFKYTTEDTFIIVPTNILACNITT